jgi:hypothetical protein
MKTCGGLWSFFAGKTGPHTYWMVHSAGLDMMAKIKICVEAGNQILVMQLVASIFTNRLPLIT